MKKFNNAKITAIAVIGILTLLIFTTIYDKTNAGSSAEAETTTPSESIILKDIFILNDDLAELDMQPESIILKDIYITIDNIAELD